MSTLAVYLPVDVAGAALVYGYALTLDGQTVSDHASVSPVLLPASLRAGEVVAVVPAKLLSWHHIELPSGIGAGSPRLRSVLEGLLEDRLLDETANMHLALEPAQNMSGDGVWVAACDRSWLHGHLLTLEAAQRRVARVVPEFSPEAGVLCLHAISDAGLPQLVATGGEVAGVLCLPLTSATLTLLPGSRGEEDVLVYADPECIELAELLMQRAIHLTTGPQRWVQASRSPWNLAQFDLASSSRLRAVKRLGLFGREVLRAPAGRPARWGFVLLLVIHLAGLNIWSWQVQNALQMQRGAIASLLTQTFPHVKLVVDAPLQMERELALLSQTSGVATGRDLEPVLAALGSVTRDDLSLAAIEFVAGAVRLKGMQPGAKEASRISALLQSLGYAARQDGDTFLIQQVAQSGGLR